MRPRLPFLGRWLSLALSSLLLWCGGPGVLRAETAVPPTRPVPGKKCLKRTRDVVILNETFLGGFLNGEDPAAVTLLAFSGGDFRAIPFQIDPLGEDGLVIPAQVNQVREKGVYRFRPNPERPPRLTGRYHLLFMASDSGDRCPDEEPLPGLGQVAEIRVTDPADQGNGWVYLSKPGPSPASGLGSAGTAPRARADYVNYVLVPREGGRMEQVRGTGVTIGFPDLEKPYASGDWIVPQTGGGSGTDIMYTVRIRLKVRFLFLLFDLDPRKSIVPSVVGYNDGPIRVTRRVHSSIVFKGIKMDRMLGKARLETESHYFRNFAFFDGEVELPDFLKKISKVDACFTTDFVRQATGIVWYNSVNGLDQGCLVDGRMSPQELGLSQDPYLWSLLTGPQGGWANLLWVHTESVRPNMKLAYLDDHAYRDDKDPQMQGAWASTGFRLDRLDKVEEKATWRSYVFAIPSSFQVSDMTNLVHLVFRPLEPRLERLRVK